VTALLAAGCAGLPRAEITAYTSAYSEILTITNGVLDIVAPYERIVIRSSAATPLSVPRGFRRGDWSDPSVSGAFAQAVEDPSLTAPRPAREDPSLTAPRPAQEDPSLTAPRPTRPAREDETLTAPRPTPAAPSSGLTLPGSCSRMVGGADPYCYEMRDGYADIGDPPLVGAYRNLANVVLRFNTLVIAYADGISGRLLQQELGGLASSVNELSKVSPVAGINHAAAFSASFSALVSGLAPVVSLAGGFYDRAALRQFLLVNYPIVDEALVLMARDSVELYANVAVGTNLFRRRVAAGSDQSLVLRRREIRRLISNWTVLIDDTRRLLGELRLAMETADGLETRLVNLEGTVRARIDTSAIKKQIATLGTPTLAP
jgi:hypothetical protein